MKILITGANGFLGSHLCLLWSPIKSDKIIAGIRRGADTSHLDSIEDLEYAFLDYSTDQSLTESLRQLVEKHGQMDVILHNAGLTKSTNLEAFYEVNLGITYRLIKAAKTTSCLKSNGKLAYISSMAALGPRPFSGPVSSYGLSKLEAEKAVKESGFPFLIYRPTALYGPFDLEFLPLFKTVRFRFFPLLSRKDQRITMIHGADAALNIINSLRLYENETIHLVSEEVYSHFDLKNALCKAFNVKAVTLNIPSFIVRLMIQATEEMAELMGKNPPLPLEKYNEISGDWDPDLSEERSRIPLEFNFSLNSGISDTLAFYKSKNLI